MGDFNHWVRVRIRLLTRITITLFGTALQTQYSSSQFVSSVSPFLKYFAVKGGSSKLGCRSLPNILFYPQRCALQLRCGIQIVGGTAFNDNTYDQSYSSLCRWRGLHIYPGIYFSSGIIKYD